MQILARTTAEDLEEFFSSVGTVRDVRLIIDYVTQASQRTNERFLPLHSSLITLIEWQSTIMRAFPDLKCAGSGLIV